MNKNKWKIATIILLVVVILETIFIMWAYSIGTEIVNNEYRCSVEICSGGYYDAYYYESYSKMCFCYYENEIVLRKYMG